MVNLAATYVWERKMFCVWFFFGVFLLLFVCLGFFLCVLLLLGFFVRSKGKF